MSASSPRNVLPVLVSQPSWQVARACGESEKQMRTSGRRNASRTGDWFIECFNGRVVVFISGENCKNLAILSSRLRIGAAAPAQKQACLLAVFSGKLPSLEAVIDGMN